MYVSGSHHLSQSVSIRVDTVDINGTGRWRAICRRNFISGSRGGWWDVANVMAICGGWPSPGWMLWMHVRSSSDMDISVAFLCWETTSQIINRDFYFGEREREKEKKKNFFFGII